jgi:hypothetical protein
MLAARRAFLDALAAGGIALETATTDYTVQNWETVIRALPAYLAAVTAITPPAWAQPWHEQMLAQIGLQQEFAQATLSRGEPYADALWGAALRTSERRLADAKASVAQSCGAFGAFADEWAHLGATTP